jgi:DNA repair protein RadC
MPSSSVFTLRETPNEERPRERMLKLGADALSNAELLAILLRTGTFSESAVMLGQRLLQEAKGLRQLVDMSLDEMLQIKGIGPAKAMQIKAGIELGKRLAKTGNEKRITVRSPEDAANYMMEEMRYLQKEHLICLFLNTKNQVIGEETASIGSLNASIVHPREIFRAAIKRSSASIICIHNHPSGDPTPSPEDLEVTNRLRESGDLIGIELLDHIIIGDNCFVSLKAKGLL